MGTPISAEKIGAPEETTAYAEEKLEKLNINTAAAEELIRLSGIGEKRAADIITYRERNGNFSCIEDIMQVSGIGEKTYEKIKEEITVGE
ncbi:helix-hairpin-helix domain-containing protein [Anaerotignum sp.]